MDASSIALRVVKLPRELERREDQSVLSLLRQTGYFENHDQITEDLLREALRSDRHLCHEWLQFSENKRTESGWYFENRETGGYVVGHFPEKTGGSQWLRYEDPIDGCAAFIKREVEDIRSLG